MGLLDSIGVPQGTVQLDFLDKDPLRTEIFNFYTNLTQASQPAVGFRRDAMLATLQALNTVYQAVAPAVKQALKFTRDAAREETQQALDGLQSGAANSAVGILISWNRVITGGTSTYVLAPSFTADMVTLAKRLEHAHVVVLMINFEVPSWYRSTYASIETALRAVRDLAVKTWDNFTETASLVYLALKLAAGFAVGYVAYTLTTNVIAKGPLAGTGAAFTQLRGHVPRALPAAASDEGVDDE